MLKSRLLVVCLLAICAPAAFAGVTVTSPTNGSTVSGAVSFVASATTSSCSKGVASMGIYTAPGVLAYVANGSSLNTSLNLNAGTYNTTVEEWDYCGGAATKAITVTVSSQSGVHLTAPTNNGTSSSPVNFSATATSSYSMTQNIKSPSMSGQATEFWVGGTTPYGDALFNNHLIGDLSSQGMPDKSHTLVNPYKNFTYDVYFYGTDLGLSQALEFDVNQFFDSMGFIW